MTMLQIINTMNAELLSLDAIDVLQLIVKLLLIVGMIFYLLFSVVVIRQIKLMRTTLITSFSPFVTVLGFVHLAIAISVALLFSFIL